MRNLPTRAGAPSRPRTFSRRLSLFCGAVLSLSLGSVHAASFINAPWLQSATTSDIWIMWETNVGTESVVEWGTTTSLGSTAVGTTTRSDAGGTIHETQLTGLQPDTRYYYRVITDDAVSQTYHFVTPAAPESERPLYLVAMSDMQRDASNPTKYEEILHDGVQDFVTAEKGADMAEAIQLALIPGDLVADGTSRDRWQDEFFQQGRDLMPYVPFYPVLGNHEVDTPYYFDYFHLPNNGTAGYEEHWWYQDHGNLRVIGMDTNTGYRLASQLDWLDTVLDSACTNDNIDFVFAELHHPYESELWPEGELDYTGEVITRMEDFSARCGKPSIHFFGHTHGYSRGQSRDHAHMMVDVATAGGNIDYWEEYPQIDYANFNVSQDEWGFVVVEIEAADNPQFRLRRLSRGNEMLSRDNELRDEVTVRRYNQVPGTPQAVGPIQEVVDPGCVTLTASAYSDPEGDLQGSAQWQVANTCNSFDRPVADVWVQHENWYNNVNTLEGDDLTDVQISGLDTNTEYCWRVRYRDRSLGWSEWSQPVIFATDETSGTACDGSSTDDSSGCGGGLTAIHPLGSTAPFGGLLLLMLSRRRKTRR